MERIVGRGEDESGGSGSGLVAARIASWSIRRRYKYGDIAVLVRTLDAIPPFERAFDRFEIPFLVSGGRTFLEAREIRDMMALLAALVNPLDEIALIGVLRSPLVGIGDEEIFRVGREGWRRDIRRNFGGLAEDAPDFAAPDRLLAKALDECGYSSDLSERARANVEKFLAMAAARTCRASASAGRDARQTWRRLRVQQSEAEAPPPDAGDVVRVMSIHAAKGLEFPVVFVSALHRGPDSRKPVIAFSAAAGLGAKWRHPVTGKGNPTRRNAQSIEELKQKEKAEENRLLYVAMTRAEDRLILSHAETQAAVGLAEAARKLVVPATVVGRFAARTGSPRRG